METENPFRSCLNLDLTIFARRIKIEQAKRTTESFSVAFYELIVCFVLI